MKIKKYQSGGYTPILREALTGQGISPGQTSPSTDKIDTKIDQEIIKALGENGLTSDTDYFLEQAYSLLASSQNMFSNNSQSSTYSQLIRINQLANRVKRNRTIWEDAKNRIISNNTGSDVALSNDGKVYALDKEGKVNKIALSALNNERSNYRALTNYELLTLRENDPNLKFNDTILNDLANSVGISQVMDQVISTIKKFGDTTSKGYTIKLNNQVQKGLEALMQLGPDGFYELERTDSKAAQDINLAIGYIYRNLNNNAKNVLKATTAAEGLDPTNINDVTNLIKAALFEHTAVSTKVNYIKDPLIGTGRKGSSGESGSLGDQQGYGQAITNNFGAARQRTIRTRDGSTNFDITVKHNQLRDKDGEIMTGISTLDEVFSALMKNGIATDRNKIYFGGMYNGDKASIIGEPEDAALVDPSRGDEVLVDSSKGIETIDVPVDVYGRPDFSAIERYQAAKDEITQNNLSASNDLYEVYHKYMLDVDANGQLRVGRFLAVPAKMTEDNPPISEYNPNNTTIDRLGEDARRALKRDVDYSNQNREKKNKIKLDWGWFKDRGVLSSTVFIPLYVNQAQQAVSDKRARTDKRSGSEYQMMQETYADPRTTNGIYSPNTNLRSSFNDL